MRRAALLSLFLWSSPALAWEFTSGVDALNDKPYGIASERHSSGGGTFVKCWKGGAINLVLVLPVPFERLPAVFGGESSTVMTVRIDRESPLQLVSRSVPFEGLLAVASTTIEDADLQAFVLRMASAKDRLVFQAGRMQRVYGVKGIGRALAAMRERCGL